MDRAKLSTLLGDLATPHALSAKQALEAGAHFDFKATTDPADYFVSMWGFRIRMAAEHGVTVRGFEDAMPALAAYIPGHVCGGLIRGEQQRFLYWLSADQTTAVACAARRWRDDYGL